jgi:hypothetical protein
MDSSFALRVVGFSLKAKLRLGISVYMMSEIFREQSWRESFYGRINRTQKNIGDVVTDAV